MPRISKARVRSDQFRAHSAEILEDSHWLDEGVRYWLNRQQKREHDYIYTENEHAALGRIAAAGKLFDGWDSYSVSELLVAARRYKADGSYEDETFLDELEARNPRQLRLGEMGHLVGFCRNIAGLSLSPFRPFILIYDGSA
jgi:hypothetical protein